MSLLPSSTGFAPRLHPSLSRVLSPPNEHRLGLYSISGVCIINTTILALSVNETLFLLVPINSVTFFSLGFLRAKAPNPAHPLDTEALITRQTCCPYIMSPTFSSRGQFDIPDDAGTSTPETSRMQVGFSWNAHLACTKVPSQSHYKPVVSYYFPKGVGEYHFGVIMLSSRLLKTDY
jgi:hypothetical protein